MNRRTFLGALGAAGALGATAGCLGAHPLPPVRGRVVRTSLVGVSDGTEDILLVATPDVVDPGPEMVDARSAAPDDGGSEPWFTAPAPIRDVLLDRFDELHYYVTVEHRNSVGSYDISPGERLRYRTRLGVFRRLIPDDRTLFTIQPVGSRRFQNTNSVFRGGAVVRKRLRVGQAGDLRTVLTVTPEGTTRGGGPDVSLPVPDERLEALRDRFPTVRLAVEVEHALGGRTFARTYRADRGPFNRLVPGERGEFAVETVDSDQPGIVERIATLDPDSPFYDDQPW